MSRDLVVLGVVLLVALPPMVFNIFMHAVKRKPFRAAVPYMVAYALVMTALPGWFFGLRGWLLALIVLVCVVGTWLFWSGMADAIEAMQASRDRQRKV